MESNNLPGAAAAAPARGEKDMSKSLVAYFSASDADLAAFVRKSA